MADMMRRKPGRYHEGVPILPFDASERTLANGLKVIVVPTGFPNLVSLQIPVKTGSRNEVEPGKSGFAHFFEHMMFRGTKAFPPRGVPGDRDEGRRAPERLHERRLHELPRHLRPRGPRDDPQIEADRFQNLDYPLEAFKTESRAVLGEYNKNSADPIQKLIEVQREHAFKAHTYKHTTMGFLKDIEDMPNQFEYSKTFFDRWYRPEYATVIVAGDVTAGRGLPASREVLGLVEGGPLHGRRARRSAAGRPGRWPTCRGTRRRCQWVSVAFHTPPFSETSREWAGARRAVGPHVRPHLRPLREPGRAEQKVDSSARSSRPNSDPYLMTIYARVKQAEDAPYVRDRHLEALAQARLDRASRRSA
jgi:zinc protease